MKKSETCHDSIILQSVEITDSQALEVAKEHRLRIYIGRIRKTWFVSWQFYDFCKFGQVEAIPRRIPKLS